MLTTFRSRPALAFGLAIARDRGHGTPFFGEDVPEARWRLGEFRAGVEYSRPGLSSVAYFRWLSDNYTIVN